MDSYKSGNFYDYPNVKLKLQKGLYRDKKHSSRRKKHKKFDDTPNNSRHHIQLG